MDPPWNSIMPKGTNNFLNKSSLDKDNKILFELLKPNMKVIDILCGISGITGGIAKTVLTGRIDLWASVAETRGNPMVNDAFISESERIQSITDFREWAFKSAESQGLYLLCVLGIK